MGELWVMENASYAVEESRTLSGMLSIGEALWTIEGRHQQRLIELLDCEEEHLSTIYIWEEFLQCRLVG